MCLRRLSLLVPCAWASVCVLLEFGPPLRAGVACWCSVPAAAWCSVPVACDLWSLKMLFAGDPTGRSTVVC